MDERYAIRIVARRTSLSPHVIRVWERRYGAVVPERSETNRRLYSEDDIKRLQLLSQATKAGYAISQVAGLPSERLAELVAEVPRRAPSSTRYGNGHHESRVGATSERSRAGGSSRSDGFWIDALFDDSLKAVEQFDAVALESHLTRAVLDLSHPQLMDRIIIPLMAQIGDSWREGELRVAHEHLASAVVRTFLGGVLAGYETVEGAPHLVIATPSGQLHEFGALYVAATALWEGWRVTYLGPDLPAAEIAAAARHGGAKAVALSIIYPPDDHRLTDELRKLRRFLGLDTAILVGGRVASDYAAILEEINAPRIDDVTDFRRHLESIRHDHGVGPAGLGPAGQTLRTLNATESADSIASAESEFPSEPEIDHSDVAHPGVPPRS